MDSRPSTALGESVDRTSLVDSGTGSARLSCAPTGIRVEQTAAVRVLRRLARGRSSPLHDRRRDGDLEAVATLGYDRIDVYGGRRATAAQVYLRLHPRSVRTLTLDGGSLLHVPVYEALAANAEHALRAQLARCSAERACRRAFPQARSELAALLERPPGELEAFGRTVTIDADAVASTVHALSLEADGVPLIPDVVRRAFRGDYVPLAQEYVDRVGPGLDARARLVMSFEILCSEPWARFDPVRVRRSSAGSYLAGVAESRARLFAQACRSVPQGSCRRARPVSSARTRRCSSSRAARTRRIPRRTCAGGGRSSRTAGCWSSGARRTACSRRAAWRSSRRSSSSSGTARGLDTACVRRIEQPPFETAGLTPALRDPEDGQWFGPLGAGRHVDRPALGRGLEHAARDVDDVRSEASRRPRRAVLCDRLGEVL